MRNLGDAVAPGYLAAMLACIDGRVFERIGNERVKENHVQGNRSRVNALNYEKQQG